MDNNLKTWVYLLGCIIAAISVIVAAILGNEQVIEFLLDLFKTKTTVSIYANQEFSGAAIYLGGDDLLNFLEANNIVAVGDTDADQLARSFLTFYLGDIPKNAKILRTELAIYCNIAGEPKQLGRLALKEFPFGQYTQTHFYNIPQNNWEVGWAEVLMDSVITSCKSQKPLVVSGNALKELIQKKLSDRWVQFIFYFQGNLVIPNQSNDAIILSKPPLLKVTYYSKEQ